MATAREENPYEGGGGFGKFRKRPFRRTQATPYDRPPTALRNPSRNNGWFSKIVDPAQRLITSSAHRLFSSVFRKRLPPPSSGTETVQEVTENHQEETTFKQAANDSSCMQQGVICESDVQINSSDGDGLTELEKLLKQKTFTRSEIDHLTALLRSRTVDSPVGEEGKGINVAASDSVLPYEQKEEYPKTPALENGIVNNFVSTPYATSSVPMEDGASPAELAKAYMGSRPSKVSPSMLGLRSSPMEDPPKLKGQHFAQKSPIMSIVPRATNTTLARVHENGFVTPRCRGRSALYSMARTPYSRVYPASNPKGVGVAVEGEPSSSAQYSLDHDMLSGSKQGVLKRRSSVLDNDIGSFGPIRRIRHKSNLLSSKGLTLPHSGSPLSIARSGVDIDAVQQPSASMQKPITLGEFEHSRTKLSAENVHDTMPSTSLPPLPSKSSEMASKILQQLDKLVSPKEKSSELRLPTVGDKSPAKLSSSMLRGQALRSLETVDSSKFLDNMRDNELDSTRENLSPSAQKSTSKMDKVENGPLKLASPTDGLVPSVAVASATVARNQVVSTAKSRDSPETKPDSHPPPKKRAFRMSAHEDYLELDDDGYPNKPVSPSSTAGKETTCSTGMAEKTTSAIQTAVQETPSGSSLMMPSKSFTMDGNPFGRTTDRSIVDEKVVMPAPIKSSIPDRTFKPSMGAVTSLISGSDKSTSLNGSAANSPLFNFGNKVAPSTEQTCGDAASKEYTKSGPIFGLEKVVSSKEPGGDAPLVNFGTNKNADNVPLAPFTFSSATAGDSAGFKFGVSSDLKPKASSSSTTVAVDVDSVSKIPKSDNADAKTNVITGFSAPPSEPAVSSAASVFTFGNSSSQNHGTAASSLAPSSPFPPIVTNNFTSQNIFSSSSLAANSSSTSSSASLTTTSIPFGTPTIIASSSSKSSTQVVSSSPTTSFFKFGSTRLPSATSSVICLRAGGNKSKQDVRNGNLGSTSFGSSSAAVASTGSGIFGFSSSTMTTSNSQTQCSVLGTAGGSTAGTMAPPSTTSGFATSTQSQSVTFGSSASSPLFGLSGNSPFPPGSSLFSSAGPATNIFNMEVFTLNAMLEKTLKLPKLYIINTIIYNLAISFFFLLLLFFIE